MFGVNDFEFEKCGDVILAPRHNIFALTCSLCHDVFMDFDEFKAHIIKQHDVYLGIPDAESVSTDEEETEEMGTTYTDSLQSEINRNYDAKDDRQTGNAESFSTDEKEAEVMDDTTTDNLKSKINGNNDEKKDKDGNDIDIENVEQQEVTNKDEERLTTTLDEHSPENIQNERQSVVIQEAAVDEEDSNKVKDAQFIDKEKSEDRIYESKLPESSKEILSVEAMDVDKSIESVNDITQQISDLQPTEDNETEQLENVSDSTEQQDFEMEDCNIDKAKLSHETNNADSTLDTSKTEEECEDLSEAVNINKPSDNKENIMEECNNDAVDTCLESNNVVQSMEKLEAEKECETINGHEHDAENENDIECATDELTNMELEKNIVIGNALPITSEEKKTDLEEESDDFGKSINNEVESINETIFDPQNTVGEPKNDVVDTQLNDDNENYVTDDEDLDLDNDEEIKEHSDKQLITKKSESDMEIEDLNKHTAVIFPGLEVPSNEKEVSKVLLEQEAFEKLELNDEVAEELDGNVGSCKVTACENKEVEKLEDKMKQNVEEKLDKQLNDDLEILKQNEAENQLGDKFTNTKNTSTINDISNENLDDEIKSIDDNIESIKETMECNEESVEELNGITSNATSEENPVIRTSPQSNEKASPIKSERRKSIKLAAIFQDLDLDLDEEDEDMKVLEQVMLAYVDDETDVNSMDENVDNGKQNIEEKINDKNEITEDNTKKLNDELINEIDENSKEEHHNKEATANLISSDENTLKLVNETFCDEYVDEMPLLMEEDSIRVIENTTENSKLAKQIEKKENSISPIKNLNENCKENCKSDSAAKEKRAESDKENENENETESPSTSYVPKNISIRSNSQNKNIVNKTDDVVEASQKQSETVQDKLRLQTDIECNEVKSPLILKKPLAYVDTPRPTQLVNRSISTKKRKLSEELTDTASPKKGTALTESSKRNIKIPKLDVAKKQQDSALQTKEEQYATMKQDNLRKNTNSHAIQSPSSSTSTKNHELNINLPKSLIVRKVPNSNTRDRAETHNKNAEKVAIQRIQKLPDIIIKPSTVSASVTSLPWNSSVDRSLNPVVRIKRLKIPKAEADSKSVKGNKLPQVDSLSAAEPSTSNRASEQSKNKTDDDEVIEDLIDQFNKEAEETDAMSETPDVKPFNDDYDAQLLSKIGLNIIFDPDFVPTKSSTDYRILTEKFARALFESGLANKTPEKNIAILNGRFVDLLKTVNNFLPDNSKLELYELKRIMFLVSRWYGDCITSMYIEKKCLTQNTQSYIRMFNFIPRTFRRVFYCEFCDKWFFNQQKKEVHRTTHFEQPNSMACMHCTKVFKRSKALESHVEKCKMKIN